MGSLRDREVACSASDRQNFKSRVWRAVSSHSSHNPQEVLLAQFSLYVHKGGLKPDSFHFILSIAYLTFASLLLSFFKCLAIFQCSSSNIFCSMHRSRCCCIVGPPSATLAQHYTNIWSISGVFWVQYPISRIHLCVLTHQEPCSRSYIVGF